MDVEMSRNCVDSFVCFNLSILVDPIINQETFLSTEQGFKCTSQCLAYMWAQHMRRVRLLRAGLYFGLFAASAPLLGLGVCLPGPNRL